MYSENKSMNNKKEKKKDDRILVIFFEVDIKSETRK